jgi:site-specific recombinase XerD
MTSPKPVLSFAQLLQDFFCEYLLAQRNASPRTISSYRDAFRLLLRFMQDRTRKPLATLTLAELDAPVLLAFLEHLERDRHNGIRSRNARLAALRSFYRYIATRDPLSLPIAQRVLAIPAKRHDRPLLGFLSREEIDAVQRAPDASTWSGRRDRALLAMLYNTGARVSEIIGLRAKDVDTASPTAAAHLRGKGRKERRVPLWKTTARLLDAWLVENSGPAERPLFPNDRGHPLSRSGVAQRLHLAVVAASKSHPFLLNRKISPHTLRHTTAMHLLQAGVEITVIALWLGHENPSTTHGYVEADLAMKQRALAKVAPQTHPRTRFKPSEDLLAFLEAL